METRDCYRHARTAALDSRNIGDEWSIRAHLKEEEAYRHFLLNTHRLFLQMDSCVCQEDQEHTRTHIHTKK